MRKPTTEIDFEFVVDLEEENSRLRKEIIRLKEKLRNCDINECPLYCFVQQVQDESPKD